MKYNSIGEQLIAKAKKLDPNYKPDKFNDMSEALDILLNNSGGDIWLDITPYLSDGENKMSISQEGYDLVYNAFYPDSLNPNNKYAGILINGTKLIFNRLTMSDTSDKEGLNFIFNVAIDGVKGYIRASIYNDKSVEYIDETDSSNKIWYDLDKKSGTITQNQYDEIKALIDNDSLAGITLSQYTDGYYPLLSFSTNGIITFVSYSIALEDEGMGVRNVIVSEAIVILPDLSINYIGDQIYTPILTRNLSSQSIISIKTDGYQGNLTIGNGLKINEAASKLELDYRFVTLKFHNLTYKFNNSENAFNTLCIDITTYSYVLDFVLNEASSILGTQVNRNNISSLFTQFDNPTFSQFILGFISAITTFKLTAYSNFHIYESDTVQQNIINNYNALLIENLDGFFFPVYTGPETIKNLWISIGGELSKNENSTFTFSESWYGD